TLSSPERLRILASPTCVSFSTGDCIVPIRLFSVSTPPTSATKRPRGMRLPASQPPHLSGGLALSTRHEWFNLYSRCRNINLLCIDYAFRPHLSFRLTLGAFTLPRKP